MGLVFGGAYLRRETRVSKSIALALQLEVNLPFLLFYFVFEGNCPSTSSQGRGGSDIWRGDLTLGFCVTALGGHLEEFIHGGAYFWNFTVGYLHKNNVTLFFGVVPSYLVYECK